MSNKDVVKKLLKEAREIHNEVYKSSKMDLPSDDLTSDAVEIFRALVKLTATRGVDQD